jgi:hypothetical protein
MTRKLHSLAIFSLVMASGLVLLTFITLGFYAYPSADDFCMVSGVAQNGLFSHLWQHYLEWSGRYSGNAFYAIYPFIFGLFHGYPLIAVLLIVAVYLATAFFLSSLFNLSISARPVLLGALGFVTVYLLGLRHTASSLYWMAGALSYQTANILMLFIMGLIIRLMDRQKSTDSITSVQLWLLALVILAMGTNETSMVSLGVIIGLAFVWHLRSGWVILRPWLWLMLTMLICFAVVYLAPGNIERESTFPLRHDWLRSIQGSFNMGSWTLLAWMGNPVFVSSSLLSPFLVAGLYQASPRSFTISSKSLLALGFITFTVPFVLQFPAWWSMGGWPPPRTVDAIFFVFLVSWFITLGALSVRFLINKTVNSGKRVISPRSNAGFSIISLLFIISILINSRFQQAQKDLWHRAPAFEEYMLGRHALIYEAIEQHRDFLTVPAYNQQFPRTIFFNDIRVDSRDWRNVCYAQYFGLQGIAQEARVKK